MNTSPVCKNCIVTEETTGDKIGTHIQLCSECSAASVVQESAVCYLTGGEPGGRCDCYACGIANARKGIGANYIAVDEARIAR